MDLDDVHAVARAVPFGDARQRLPGLGARVGALGEATRGEKRHLSATDPAREQSALPGVDLVDGRLVEWAARAVQVGFATQARELANRSIERNGLRPRRGVTLAHPAPLGIGVKRAPDTRRTRHGMLGILAAEPRDAIGTIPRRPQVENQRIAKRYPMLATLAHAGNLVGRYADPLLDVHTRPGHLARHKPNQSTKMRPDGSKLVFVGALTPDNRGITTRPFDEKRERGTASAFRNRP